MPRGPREPLSAQSDRRCRTGQTEITAAEGPGPSWKVACTLAVVLLCLHSLLLHTKVAGTADEPARSAVSDPQAASVAPPSPAKLGGLLSCPISHLTTKSCWGTIN
ncbi:hypothetical protein R6Z07M_009478 [Ovis aries]